jgi:hypothetical protein
MPPIVAGQRQLLPGAASNRRSTSLQLSCGWKNRPDFFYFAEAWPRVAITHCDTLRLSSS